MFGLGLSNQKSSLLISLATFAHIVILPERIGKVICVNIYIELKLFFFLLQSYQQLSTHTLFYFELNVGYLES